MFERVFTLVGIAIMINGFEKNSSANQANLVEDQANQSKETNQSKDAG